MTGRFSRFREDLLLALVKAAEARPGQYVDPKRAADEAGLQYLAGWVRKAVQTLENRGLVNATYAMASGPDGGMDIVVTGEGLEEAEELIAARQEADESEQIPAADRLVQIDHNSLAYAEAHQAVQEATEAVRGNNEYAASEPEDYEQRLAELEGGTQLLKARRIRLEAIRAVLIVTLKYLAKKFADNVIGKLADSALRALIALLGMPS